MRKMKRLLVPILTVLVIGIISLSHFWFKLEHSARDFLFMIRGTRAVYDDIVIVEISDLTFTILQQRWPLTPDHYLRLIDNLKDAGAKQIVFCIDLDNESFFPLESLIVAASERFDNIVWSRGNQINNGRRYYQQTEDIIEEELDLPNYNRGILDVYEDKDGFIRNYQLIWKTKSDTFFSMGVVSLGSLHGDPKWFNEIINKRRFLQIRNKVIPKVNKKSCLINYYGPARSFKYYDLVDILDDSTFTLPGIHDLDKFEFLNLNQHFKDKIVLVGITSIEFQDYHLTPFSFLNHERMPGVEIQANFIQMVLNDNYLTNFSIFLYFLILLLFSTLIFWMNLSMKKIRSFLLNSFIIICYLIIVYMSFYNSKLILPVLLLPAILIIQYLFSLIILDIRSNRLKEFIRRMFQEKISPELLNEMIMNYSMKNFIPQEKEISVLKVSLLNFRQYLKTHAMKESMDILNDFVTSMNSIIIKNNGYLDRLTGDDIVALIGVPVAIPDHAYWACKAAFEMNQIIGQLKSRWMEKKKDPLEIGFCITSGSVIAGNLGSRKVFNFTAMGDILTNCSDLSDMFDDFETSKNILIDEITYNLAGEKITAYFLDDVELKNRKEPVKVYELIEIEQNS